MIKSKRFTHDILCDVTHVLNADVVESFDGVLLDNVLMIFDRSDRVNEFGYIAIYESFVNSNLSEYYVEISDTPEDNEKLLERWHNFTEKQEA